MSRISPPARREWSRSARVCLAIVLAAGLNVVWGLGLALVLACYSALTESSEPWVQLVFAPGGTPVLVHRFGDGRAPEYTTLDGRPIAANNSSSWLQGADLEIVSPQANWSLTKPVGPVIEAYTDALPTPTDWFLLQFRKPRPRAYFVGYDRVSQQRVGYLGRAGFQFQEPTADQTFAINRVPREAWDSPRVVVPSGTGQGVTPAQYYYEGPPEPLAGTVPREVLYLVGPERVSRIDLRARTVATVLEERGLDGIGIVSRARGKTPAAGTLPAESKAKPILEDALVLREKGNVIVLDASGRREAVYHIPTELSDRSFHFYQTPDRTALAHIYRDDPAKQMTYQDLIWFTKEGTIVRRIDGALAFKTSRMSVGTLALIVAVAMPGPAGPIGATFVYPTAADYEQWPATYHGALLKEIPSALPALILGAIWAALAIGLYYRRAARYGEPRRAAWFVTIALLGVPGYFGYVLQHRWPARLPCPSCGTLAPRDRDVCFNCSQEFPPPAPKGLEIFA